MQRANRENVDEADFLTVFLFWKNIGTRDSDRIKFYGSAGELADALESCSQAKRPKILVTAAVAAFGLLVSIGGLIRWINAAPSGADIDDSKHAQTKDDGKKQTKPPKKAERFSLQPIKNRCL